MMHARCFRLGKGDQVMVTAMDTMHEGDPVARGVRNTKSQNPVIEFDCTTHVPCEYQHMCHAPRPDYRGVGICERPALICRDRDVLDRRFLIRRRLFGDANFNQVSIMVVEPETIALESRGRIAQRNTLRFHVTAEGFEIILENAEGHERHLFARPFGKACPSMVAAKGIKPQSVALLLHVEAKGLVKMARLFEIGHRHV